MQSKYWSCWSVGDIIWNWSSKKKSLNLNYDGNNDHLNYDSNDKNDNYYSEKILKASHSEEPESRVKDDIHNEKIQLESESAKNIPVNEHITKKSELSKDNELIEKIKELFDAVEYKINW